MADQDGPKDPEAVEPPGQDPKLFVVDRTARATDIVPIGPNLIALIMGFTCLMAAPTVCLHTLEAVWDDAIVEIVQEPVGNYLVLASWDQFLLYSAAGAILFLVIGLILQALQHRRPFASRWPTLLAFPIAWGLIVPETVLRGGTLLSGAIVATAVALAFAVQWGSLVILRETMD
jgi:hypothetical protein